MKVKNISKGNFNLKSGVVKPGAEGEVTLIEFKVLAASGKIEQVVEASKLAPKPKAKPKANG